MILLLGGTSDARDLAGLLDRGSSRPFVSSLAGRVARPRLPVGAVRVGGFGGVDGLRTYLREAQVAAVVDATHPFAEGMTANAAAACAVENLPLLRLERPGWSGTPEAATWHWAGDHDDAAATAAGLGQRPFLTVGRQTLGRFTAPLSEHEALVRVVDPPEIDLPERWRLLLDRGPYTVDGERALLAEHRADVLVTKDSGGSYTWGKMAAAAELGVPVVVVRRRRASADTTVVDNATDAATWLDALA